MNKFFNNISYKNKVLYFSCLLLTTSVVCPLTSCGSDGTSNDIGGFDKEFGFDAQTYNRLESQFISKFGASLIDDKGIEKDVYINKFNNFLQNDLAILRNKLFDPAQNYSFTVRTNTLMDYASKNYNIQLNRNTNISQIDFDNLKQSSLENLVIYMENKGFTKVEIDEKKVEFNNKFDKILENYKLKTLDNAQILMQLRVDVIDCWADLDDEFAYLSAYNHLKKFFDEYEFIVKDQQVNNDNNYLWDKLLITPGFMGENNTGKIDQDINCEISDWIDKLFTISKKSQESEKEDNKDTLANGTSWKEIIPGFILTPVLKTMSQNIYSNEYYMNIDWQLIHAKYQDKDQETKNKVIAHLATTKDGKAVDYTDFKDGQLPSDKYQFTKYNLKATPNYQQEKMTDAYFDQSKRPDQKITFSWDKDAIGIDYFLPSDAKNKEDFIPSKMSYEVQMSRDNLSLIGLQLNGTNLSDLLDKKTNLQNSQSTNTNDNLKIEEKFVKYCNINSDSIVSFSDNEISNNTIQNSFTVAFTNSNNIEYKVETKSNMNNIGPSKMFFNNAVNLYKKVADYVDAGKILNKTESLHWLSNAIKVELTILFGIFTLILICVLFRYKYYFYNEKLIPAYENNVVRKDFKYNFTCLFFILITTLSLLLVWKFTISDPISNDVDNVKKWNDKINGSKSGDYKKINVIDKVNDDKDNFASSDEFMKYYEKNSNNAFVSYFYYFHFIELSQNQSNNKQLTTLDEQVKKDYDDFNNSKLDCKISDKNFGRIVIGVISMFVIIFGLYVLYINYVTTRKVISIFDDYNNDYPKIHDGVQNMLDDHWKQLKQEVDHTSKEFQNELNELVDDIMNLKY